MHTLVRSLRRNQIFILPLPLTLTFHWVMAHLDDPAVVAWRNAWQKKQRAAKQRQYYQRYVQMVIICPTSRTHVLFGRKSRNLERERAQALIRAERFVAMLAVRTTS